MKLHDYLRRNKLTAAAFAARIGVQPSTITRILHCQRTPDIYTLEAIENGSKRKVRAQDFYGMKRVPS